MDKDGSKTPPPGIGGKPTTPPPSSSTTPPPPPTPPTPQSERTLAAATTTTSPLGTKRPITPSGSTKKTKSSICPVCNKDMYHEKALNGHIRWHTHEEREAANRVARALALSVNVNEGEGSSSSKRMKVPDLNKPPPPED